jgi:hypothetical protein
MAYDRPAIGTEFEQSISGCRSRHAPTLFHSELKSRQTGLHVGGSCVDASRLICGLYLRPTKKAHLPINAAGCGREMRSVPRVNQDYSRWIIQAKSTAPQLSVVICSQALAYKGLSIVSHRHGELRANGIG